MDQNRNRNRSVCHNNMQNLRVLTKRISFPSFWNWKLHRPKPKTAWGSLLGTQGCWAGDLIFSPTIQILQGTLCGWFDYLAIIWLGSETTNIEILKHYVIEYKRISGTTKVSWVVLKLLQAFNMCPPNKAKSTFPAFLGLRLLRSCAYDVIRIMWLCHGVLAYLHSCFKWEYAVNWRNI